MKIIGKWMGIVLLALPTLFATNIMAQDSKKPTLEDLLPGGETYRFAENKWYQWYGDAACLELGIDSIKGTWAVNGLGAKAGKEFTAITLEEPTSYWQKRNWGSYKTSIRQKPSTPLMAPLPGFYSR